MTRVSLIRTAGLAWLGLGSSILVSPSLKASEPVGLKIRLVSEVSSIRAGQPFHVGLLLQHDPGYHTYYRQPGIVGVPTTLQWFLPPGFLAGELEYPEPETTMMFKIRAQGYERDLLLQCRITPPTGLKPGSSVRLVGRAAWMCCGHTCHPGTAELSLELPVTGADGEPSWNLQWRPQFEAERRRYARRSEAWQASAEEHGQQVTLRLRPQTSGGTRPLPPTLDPGQIVFFTEDGWINTDSPQFWRVEDDGSLTASLQRAEVYLGQGIPDRLRGVLRRSDGWLAGEELRSLIVEPELRR